MRGARFARRLIRLSRAALPGYAFATAAVTVVSVGIGFVLGQVNLANASMLSLLAVMARGVAFGRGPAIFASIAAFLTFDWFFVEPLHQFTVSDPNEWVSLLLFLLTAIVTGQLAAAAAQIGLAVERDRLHKEATEAEILRRTDQLRATLLNAVSHDLRTPLPTIMAAAGRLRQRDAQRTGGERPAFAQRRDAHAEH